MSRKESVVERIKVPLHNDLYRNLKPFKKKNSKTRNQSDKDSKTNQSKASIQNMEEDKSLDEKMVDSDREDSLENEKNSIEEKALTDNENEPKQSVSVGVDSISMGSDSIFISDSVSSVGDSVERPDKNLAGVTEEIKGDIEKALDNGERLEKMISKQDKSIKSMCRQVTEDYELYSLENMDDLFDGSGESDTENAGNEPDSQSQKTEDEKSDNEPNEIETDQDLSSKDKYRSLLSNPDFENLESKIAELKNEAYHRHLKGITEDILTCIEKLKVLFVIAFEQLDCAEGRDQCNLIVEDFFFKPLWKHLLTLFRYSLQYC